MFLNYAIKKVLLFPLFSFVLLTSVVSAEVHTLQSRVSVDADDAEERANGSMSLTNSDLELVFDHDLQTVGICFTNLAIPDNATITKAYIQFKADETSTESTQLTIHGENIDNASTFSTVRYNISSRTKTNASVSWSPAAWSTVGAEGEDQRTSDLTSIVQEIVSESGWSSGNAMAFIITGTGKRVAESYKGDQAGAPLFYVEYTTDTTAPVITLIGDNPLSLTVGDTFSDPGATAQDNIDGDLTLSIQTTSDVNTSAAGTYTVTYNVSDAAGNPATATRSVIVSDGTLEVHTLQSRVSLDANDAEESAGGSMSLSSTDLELVFDHELQTVGIRFTDLAIPQNAAITKAYIQFKVDETSSESTQLTIHGENIDNASTFSTATYNISSRTKTNASVSWSPAAWSTVGAEGEDQRTSDLTSIVQEIVSESGWSSGNAMAFIITGTGERVAESYKGDPTGAPLFYVEYTTDPTIIPPVITLIGDNPINLNIGDTFSDPGATAQDNIDGDITASIEMTSDVNTSAAGTYTVAYSVTDSDGNSAAASRSVFVIDPTVDPNILNVPSVYPTIQEALAHAVDGNTILIAPGIYEIHEDLYISKNDITIASRYLTSGDENDIDNTIIKGDPQIYLFTGKKNQSENLKFIGLTLTDADKHIIFQDGYGEVHYCKLYNTTSRDAISFNYDAGGAVTHCRIENAADDAIDVDTELDAGQDGGSFLFAYNEFINSGDDDIEVHLWSNSGANIHFDIHDNIFLGAGEDGIQLIDYDHHSNRTFDVYRNIFQNITDAAIGSMFESTIENFQGTAMTERVRIYNNYFYNNRYHITGGDNMIILNNIFEGASGTAIHRVKTDSITDYNLFYANTIDTSDTLTGSHNLYTNPQRNSDFTLQQVSLAIDAGTPSYTHNSEVVLQIPSSEYVGQNPDMGRYEYGMSGTVPTITLIGDNPINLNLGDTFSDPGAMAQDHEDGDLTASIQTISDVNTSAAGTYMVTYTVTDSDGNSAMASRSVVVSDPGSDTTVPVITLIGDNPINLNVGDTFNDPGATAQDNIDGDITASIESTSDIDTSAAGTYTVTYTVSDAAGNMALATRSVVVSDNTGSQTLQSRVSSDTNDAEESAGGSMSLASTDLELVFDHELQTVGIRFTNLAIPENAAITKAYIQFKVDETSSESTQLTIHGENIDNASTFSTATYNISSRTKTNASVSWSPAACKVTVSLRIGI